MPFNGELSGCAESTPPFQFSTSKSNLHSRARSPLERHVVSRNIIRFIKRPSFRLTNISFFRSRIFFFSLPAKDRFLKGYAADSHWPFQLIRQIHRLFPTIHFRRRPYSSSYIFKRSEPAHLSRYVGVDGNVLLLLIAMIVGSTQVETTPELTSLAAEP